MKFYNIIKESDFSHLTNEDKIKFLIDNEVFTESKNCFINDFYRITIDREWEEEYSFLNFTVTHSKKEYFLNIDFINEIFEKYTPLFQNSINRNQLALSTFESQLDFYPEIEFNNLKSDLLKGKRSGLHNKVKFEFNKYCNWDDFEIHQSILKKFLISDLKGIYEYLSGEFTDRYFLDMTYGSYLSNESKLFYIENHKKNQLNDIKSSIPRKIGLLEEVGFFKLDSFKGLKKTDLHKVLAFLFDVNNDDKNKLASIRRNYKMLDKDSIDNGQKYTAHKHVGYVLKEILE